MELHAAWHETELKKHFPGLLEKLDESSIHDMNDIRRVVDNFNSVRMRRGMDTVVSERIFPLLFVENRWRKSRIVYDFDADLMSALSDQVNSADQSAELPADLILHLPFECISIQSSHIFIGIPNDTGEITETMYDGNFFVTITEPDDIDEWPTLYSVWFDDKGRLEESYLPIMSGKTLYECRLKLLNLLKQKIGTTSELTICSSRMYMHSMIAMQTVLYLVSQNAEIEENTEKGQKANPKKPSQKKKTATVNEVGYHIGAVLRKAKVQHNGDNESNSTGSTKRSHARRGHWHHFWTGPHDGERALILKWVAPTIIHPEEKDELPTIVPVE